MPFCISVKYTLSIQQEIIFKTVIFAFLRIFKGTILIVLNFKNQLIKPKGALSGLRQFLATKSPLKVVNVHSQDI